MFATVVVSNVKEFHWKERYQHFFFEIFSLCCQVFYMFQVSLCCQYILPLPITININRSSTASKSCLVCQSLPYTLILLMNGWNIRFCTHPSTNTTHSANRLILYSVWSFPRSKTQLIINRIQSDSFDLKIVHFKVYYLDVKFWFWQKCAHLTPFLNFSKGNIVLNQFGNNQNYWKQNNSGQPQVVLYGAIRAPNIPDSLNRLLSSTWWQHHPWRPSMSMV